MSLTLNPTALHGASSYPGAQFYMECAQLNIQGGSGAKSPATVAFPGAYRAPTPVRRVYQHPCTSGGGLIIFYAGITVNIYYPPLENYTIPGEIFPP